MEIERKWMVTGWPEGLPLEEEFTMRQGYISVQPTVRIREEALTGGSTFSGKLSRIHSPKVCKTISPNTCP